MMDNDDKLIESFMLTHKHEIADNGFSRRVIRQLPQRAKWLSDMLSVACTIICCVLFYVYNGFEILFQTIYELITAQSYHLITESNFQSLVIATIVLVVIGVQRVCSLKW